jgi:hypothetical protein
VSLGRLVLAERFGQPATVAASGCALLLARQAIHPTAFGRRLGCVAGAALAKVRVTDCASSS